jgi:predicted nucleic acid-binding protein
VDEQGMTRAVLDTNILIDYLNGVVKAERELALYDKPMISVITWIEVLVGANQDTHKETLRFLKEFERIEVTAAIANMAVDLRRKRKLKLPDVIIFASARVASLPLVTRNTKDFSATEPGVRIPYRL